MNDLGNLKSLKMLILVLFRHTDYLGFVCYVFIMFVLKWTDPFKFSLFTAATSVC